MEFKIKRSSYSPLSNRSTSKPCPEAYTRYDETQWYIMIDTLEELFELISEVECGVIVFPDEDEYELEIYDEYRE